MARRSDHSRKELRQLALDAAAEIVRENGLSQLKARKIAERIGYTVGTLYQVFKNLDDLVEQMNLNTLSELYDHCEKVDFDREPAESLMELALSLATFIDANSKLWRAVIFHQLPDEHVRPKEYDDMVIRLHGLIMNAINPYFSSDQKEEQMHDARVLWASMYGIYSLGTADRLSKDESITTMVETLIEMYIALKG